MPKLGPLVGALKLHEFYICADGLLKKKDLPNDIFYKQVTICESRKNKIGYEEPNVNVNVNESVLNNAFMEVDVEERTSNGRRNRIMTRAEIQEELEADVSDYDDDDE